MSAEIASAYVRIRPNMSGFQSATESGVKSAFSNVAKIVGVALSAGAAFKFGEDIIEGAASLQKSVEAINLEFGKAGKAVTQFGEDGAKSLGISANLADSTSARFGILFKNLGIGGGAAAQMTVGFEKLAGSIAEIRGIDPSTVLQNLPLAAAGNLRSLKQLGLSFTTAQLSAEAFKLGLTDTINQALTPAQKAIALYNLATQNFSTFQDQAKAHAGDLTNQVFQLKAAWANAKDELGEGLLPIASKVITALSDGLTPAVNGVRLVFSDLSKDVRQFAAFVAPAFKPIEDAIGRIKSDLTGNGGGIDKLKKDFQDLSPAAKGVVIAIGLITAAVVALVAAAFPITATILVIGGLGVAFQQAYEHSSKFRDIVKDVGSWITGTLVPAIEDLAKKAAPAFAQLYATAQAVFADLKKDFEEIASVAKSIWTNFGTTIKTVLGNAFNAAIQLTQDFLKNIQGVLDLLTGILSGNWSKAWSGLKEIVTSTLDSVETFINTFATNVEAIFVGLWNKVGIETLEGIKTLVGYVNQLSGANALGGLLGAVGIHLNPGKSLQKAIQGQIDSMKAKDIEDSLKAKIQSIISTVLGAIPTSTGDAATDAGKKIGDKVGAGAKDSTAAGVSAGIKAGLDSAVQAAEQSIVALQTRLSQAQAKLQSDITASVNKAKQNLITIGSTLGTDIATALDAPLQIAGTKIQDQQDKIALLFDAKTASLQAAQAKLSLLQSQLGLKNDQLALSQLRDEVVLPGGKQLSTNNQTALKQLQSLLKTAPQQNRSAIQQFINQFQSSFLSLQSDKLGITGQKLSIAEAAKQTPLQLATERIKVQQDAIDKIKTATAKQLADLTSNFDKDDNLKKFVAGVQKILTGSEVQKAFKTAGNLLGTSFTTGLNETAAGILQQARAIRSSPHRAGGGQESTIVRPLVTMAKDQAEIRRIQKEIGNKQVALQQKILKAAQKTAANTALLNSLGGASSKQRNPGKQTKKSSNLTGTGA